MITIKCASFESLQPKIIDVEATKTKGLPSFNIVGMPSNAINESKDRVKSALLTNDYKFPPKRITINLAPTEIKKEGSHFDLAIALSIMLDTLTSKESDTLFLAELGLDGRLKESSQLFALILSTVQCFAIKRVIVAHDAVAKLQMIPNLEVIGFQTLNEVVGYLTDENANLPVSQISHLRAKVLKSADEYYYYESEYPYDFGDVKGQEIAKRAALICAVGAHNIILEGSPGCGKSMIAKRLRYILAPMQLSEVLNVAKLESLDAKEPDFKALRSFKAPHHTATSASIFGGGSHKAMIGEVALADGGVLFFDELPYFSKNVLESLREPLEDNKIRISRVHSKVEYDANFIFIGAMNPCPCGNLLHQELACTCNELEIQRYQNRLSQPFLDRIDLHIQMQNVSPNDSVSVSSQEMHQQVLDAFAFQKSRSQAKQNAKLTESEIAKFCVLAPDANDVLERAIERFHLSFRAINKVKKVARSIADLEHANTISAKHIMEALSYRKR